MVTVWEMESVSFPCFIRQLPIGVFSVTRKTFGVFKSVIFYVGKTD